MAQHHSKKRHLHEQTYAYNRIHTINGDHPFKAQVPGAYVEYAVRKRRGGRVLRLERLRLRTMLIWLLHVVLQRYDACDQTMTERPITVGVGI